MSNILMIFTIAFNKNFKIQTLTNVLARQGI